MNNRLAAVATIRTRSREDLMPWSFRSCPYFPPGHQRSGWKVPGVKFTWKPEAWSPPCELCSVPKLLPCWIPHSSSTRTAVRFFGIKLLTSSLWKSVYPSQKLRPVLVPFSSLPYSTPMLDFSSFLSIILLSQICHPQTILPCFSFSVSFFPAPLCHLWCPFHGGRGRHFLTFI